MSDIEKLFLAVYPLWPKVLLEKFSGLLSLEVAKFNPEINPQIIEQYKNLGVSQKIKIEPYMDNASYLLLPSNSAKISQVYYGRTPIQIYRAKFYGTNIFATIESAGLVNWEWFQGKVLYDTRIFKSVTPSIDISYVDAGYSGSVSWLGFMSYDSAYVSYITAIKQISLSVELYTYGGASSVLAMVENGVSVDVDQKLLAEFVTFLNAYNKYGGELAAANSLQAEKNRQTMTDYKNSISEKLNSRKNELNDLRTQISFAAKNETASAKRDMQSLTLSAKSLMLQLQDKLK